MKLVFTVAALLAFASSVLAGAVGLCDNELEKRSGHVFTFKNNCGHAVTPHIANTRCGYSPRCDNRGGQSDPGPVEELKISQDHIPTLTALVENVILSRFSRVILHPNYVSFRNMTL
ncbi:hypothetical protein BD626DRAFT_538213 [Schizophyllum amplum]|uniref:Uncharacterized protein n=1 Tax=Schizophyllum amplum TaxID=97359 RepID=A0A550C8X5_9AGAR|nr:hypothetical protein BD626DRAFT_538213 [Auriculariopsis ampla]